MGSCVISNSSRPMVMKLGFSLSSAKTCLCQQNKHQRWSAQSLWQRPEAPQVNAVQCSQTSKASTADRQQPRHIMCGTTARSQQKPCQSRCSGTRNIQVMTCHPCNVPDTHVVQAAALQTGTITFAVTLNQWPQRTPASMQKRM